MCSCNAILIKRQHVNNLCLRCFPLTLALFTTWAATEKSKKNFDSVTPRLKYKQLYKTKMVILLDAARMTLYSILIKKPSFKKRQTTMPHKNFPLVASSAASRDDMPCCPENSDIVIEDIMQVHIRI